MSRDMGRSKFYMAHKRCGKIYINGGRRPDVQADLIRIFTALEFFPWRAEYLFERDAFELVGVSPNFDILKDNEITPEYTLLVRKNEETGDVEAVSAARQP